MKRWSLVILITCIASVFVGCSMEGVTNAKAACAAEIKAKIDVDVSNSPSNWAAHAGTNGKSTTISYSQTESAPAVVCVTSGGVVKSLTKSETTTF